MGWRRNWKTKAWKSNVRKAHWENKEKNEGKKKKENPIVINEERQNEYIYMETIKEIK